MSRLTLGGRKRAGGKVLEYRKHQEKDDEDLNKQIEDPRQTADESNDGSSIRPKYNHLKSIHSCHFIF